MSNEVALLVMALLLLANAFFVGAEFAVTSSRRAQIEPLVEQGVRGSASALYAVEHVSLMLAVCQLGITLASTGLGVVAEPAIARMIEGPLVAWGLPAASAHVFGFVVALVIVLYLHVVLGEMVPKNLSISAHEKLILIYGPVLVWMSRTVRWLVQGLDSFANWVLRRFGIEPKGEVTSAFSVEEVASIVELSQAEGTLEDNLGLLSGSLEFSTELVSAVMLSPQTVVTVPQSVTPEQLEQLVAQTGYSRFPVEDTQHTICGYLHLKDVLWAGEDERGRAVPRWKIRPLPTVEPQMEVEEALEAMQQSGTHLAQVRDQGALVGIIFLEDILELLIGEVRDGMQRRRS